MIPRLTELGLVVVTILLNGEAVATARFQNDREVRVINELGCVATPHLSTLMFSVGSRLHDQFSRLIEIEIDEGDINFFCRHSSHERRDIFRDTATSADRIEIPQTSMERAAVSTWMKAAQH